MDLSIVVPSFKQAQTIQGDLYALSQTLQGLPLSHEIIVVVDGNIDNTVQQIQNDVRLSHIIVEELEKNEGKGAALKHGLSMAQGDIVGFIDAGGDIGLLSLPIMLDIMKFSHADIVIGSKRHPLSRVSYPFIRKIYSTGYQIINWFLFRLRVRDTQVGLKLFRREVIKTILPHVTIKRFAFDLELLVVARLLGYNNIIESPISIQHTFKSTINTRVVMETLIDTIKLYRKMKGKIIVPLSPAIEVTHVPQKATAHEYEVG